MNECYLGNSNATVEKIADSRKYDLYLVTGDEIPFTQDGTRDGEHIRHDMHKRFIEKLTDTGRSFKVITGSREVRRKAAIKLIDAILTK